MPNFEEIDYWMNDTSDYLDLQPQMQNCRADGNLDLSCAQSHLSCSQTRPLSRLDSGTDTPISLAHADFENHTHTTGSPFDILAEVTQTQLPTSMDSSCPRPPSENSQLRQDTPPVPNIIADYRTKLVEFYFKEAASILTVFDGALNPFRTVIGTHWTSSNLLYLTIKSLAAVFLSNTHPQMAAVAVSLRQEAFAILVDLKQEEMDEKDLLALFMIGATPSWFNTNDTGREHFSFMIKNVRCMMASGQIASTNNNRHFFKDLLICWRMFLAFIEDDAGGGEDDDDLHFGLGTQAWLSNPNQPASVGNPILHVPHPLTGVASGVQKSLIKVGRLVRRNRRLVNDRRLQWLDRAIIKELDEQLQQAEQLEEELFRLRVPSAEEIVDTKDSRTPAWHLATLANVYRHVGLLLLYRVFSDVRATARRRLCSRPSTHQQPERCRHEDRGMAKVYEADNDDVEWLRSFALRIVAALRSIPVDSGTKDFHPFLLVAVSSDLPMLARKAPRSSVRDHRQDQGGNHNGHQHEEVQGLPPAALDVHDARAFVLSRLQALQFALPDRPVKRCIEIVKAVWDPQGADECPFWMDVMIQNNWEAFLA